MMDVIGWLSIYAGAVTLIVAAAHRREVDEHRARHGEANGLGREVESVPVHDRVGRTTESARS